jgi:hypothetical protein
MVNEARPRVRDLAESRYPRVAAIPHSEKGFEVCLTVNAN